MPACSNHPGTSATSTCGICKKPECDSCITCEIDGQSACTSCGDTQGARSKALGAALVLLVAVSYLVTLAVAYVVFRARPFVGGFAAVVAIVFGRTLHAHVHLPVIVRHSTGSD